MLFDFFVKKTHAATKIITNIMHPMPTPIAVGEVAVSPFDALLIEDAPTAAAVLLVGVKLG